MIFERSLGKLKLDFLDIKSEPYRREDTRNFWKKSRPEQSRVAQLSTMLW